MRVLQGIQQMYTPHPAQVQNQPSTNFAMVFTGNLKVDTPGQYTAFA